MDKIIEKLDIYINQNLLILIVSFVGLGFTEYNKLQNGWLYKLSMILSIASLFSVIVSLVAYTFNYWVKKTRDK